jgi:hypothetical protein
LPSLYQPRANGIFPDVLPLRFRKFILSQQAIEDTFLPFPDCLSFASDEALQASRELGDPRIPIPYWRTPVRENDRGIATAAAVCQFWLGRQNDLIA